MFAKRILVLCPDIASPTGGVRQLYRHVDILNRHGFTARLVHESPGFRCTWFDHQTEIVYPPDVNYSLDDILVVPETIGPAISQIAPGIPKVVFNQNCYYTFCLLSANSNQPQSMYDHPDVVAVLTVSRDSRDYLEFAFPNKEISIVRCGVDPHVFKPAGEKQPQIAFMPRKNAGDANQVIHLLQTQSVLNGWTLAPINNCSIAEAAAIMSESRIFMSFGHPEGFGLPAAEAMLSECYVVGYHGFGGKEFFLREFCSPIEVGDIVGFAKCVVDTVLRFEVRPIAFNRCTSRAAAFIRANYSLENEASDLVEYWSRLLSRDFDRSDLGTG